MFFIPSPYLTLAKLGGSLPKYQGDTGSSEVNLTDSDGDGIPDNAVIEDGSAYWTDKDGNIQMANITPQGNWEMANNDENQGGGNVDPATGLTFRQAFRQARDAGEETFMWNGKSYNTKTRSEANQEDNNEEVEENNQEENNTTDDDTDDKNINENDDISEEDLSELEKAQLKANQADLGFRSPDQATILSGIGDNPYLELIDAVERGVKSFSPDQYYDPGTKEDYMKYTVRNTTDQDMVYDPEDRLKAMYNPGKYLKTNKEFEDEIIEENMMDFYKRRRKEGAGGKDMYGRVKDFDVDQYRETGIGATYGRRGPGLGDQMENKYQDASYLGFSNVDGTIRPADYLTRGPGFAGVEGDPNTYIRQDFEGSSTPFDRSDDSMEWQRSMRNPLNQPIQLMPKVGPSLIPTDNTEPELIRATEPVDSPTDYQEPGTEDLLPQDPNQVKYGGSLAKYSVAGEYRPTMGQFSQTFTGYNPLTNNVDPMVFSPDSSIVNNTNTVYGTAGLLNGTQEDKSAFSANAQMYASSQAMQRSMDSFNAFTADMNKRMENPSLSMNQVDTNPLSLPQVDFSIPQDLQKTMDMVDYSLAESQGRVTSDGNILPSAEQIQQQSDEFSANLQSQMDNIPEYQGTQENLDRFDEANERGFEGDLAAMDEFDAQQEQEQAEADAARAQIQASSDRPNLLTRGVNTLNRALDSTAAQTYSKVSNMAIDVAKPLTKILRQRNERKQKQAMFENAYLADNMFAATDADTSGNKGNYDPNTGIFRPDDKVVAGTTMSARFGGSFFNQGGEEVDIDINTYKQLVAAGAEIKIL